MKTIRRFYLICVNHCEADEPPEVLDINEPYLHPLDCIGATINPETITYRASVCAAQFDWMLPGGDTYRDLDYVAYMVVNAHTARLAWRKRAGNVRGEWAHWHGNPKHKRPREVAE